MAEDRVPQPDTEFDEYINGTAGYLLLTPGGPGTPTNWERLNLVAAENTLWQDYKADWNTKYATVVDNKNKKIRDSNAIEEKNDARDAFNDWVVDKNMNKLNRIAASPNVTAVDRAVFNIKKRDDIPTARPKIKTAPYVDLKGLEGAVTQVTCRVESDSTRSSMHPDADEIEMKYILVGANDPAPVGPEACPNSKDSKKAIFQLSSGVPNAGKRLYAYLRWHNVSEEAKSGPWSQVDTIIVGD